MTTRSRKLLSSGLLLLSGCVGYSDGTGTPQRPFEPEAGAPDVEVGEPEPEIPDAAVHELDAGERRDAAPAAPRPDAAAAAPDADVLLGYNASFDGYLTDRRGQALYMLADDVAGARTTACLADCAEAWPPFDLGQDGLQPGPGLLSGEFTRFHRQDGHFQTTYKGHPLYLRAAEAGTRDVNGDGAEGRWFVARDYLAFLGRTSNLAPAGSNSFNALYLTNGFGRALYVCFDDTEAGPGMVPVSSCLEDCALRHPLWSVAEAGRTSILPSIVRVTDLGQFERSDGVPQLTYRGWPLYYFGDDLNPGDIQAHNQEAWRAIDPVNFGLDAGTP